MLIVAEWLQEYLTESVSLPQIVAALEAAGVEVESVQHPPRFDEKLVVAKVSGVKKHPQAERLKLAEVTAGGQTLKVVCGAPNLKKGQHVVLAHVGAVLPDGTEIKSAEIRGEKSAGMLCSEKELGLGSDHDGILVLGSEAAVGTPLGEVYDEKYSVIDIKTAANRSDLQSYYGLAVEVAAHTKSKAVPGSQQRFNVTAAKSDELFNTELKEQVLAYALVKLKVEAGRQAPEWMQRRLRLSGIKTINAVVDITNYCMLESGQPLHAFDAAKVSGRLEIRFANEDESLTTLDGTKRSLSKQDIVIADRQRAIGLAGIMGGESSEITDKTREVLLESATFDGGLVRKSARRHGLRTEASARFERGLPTQSVKQAMKRACQLLIEHAGAEVIAYKHQLNTWPWVQHVGVRASYMRTMSGLGLEKERIAGELRKLDFDAEVFDIVAEAKKHLNKPYKWGASYRTDGTDAFDCGYLIDYLYSLIGKMVGHSAPQIMSTGREVSLEELKVGDTLFRDGAWKEVSSEERDGVSHVAMYIGNGQIIHAENYARLDGEWRELPAAEQVVRVDPLEIITKDPQFLGARRHVDDLTDYVRVTVPWWRPDVKLEADVMEEVVKLVGLDEIPATLPSWRPELPRPDTYWPRWQEIRWLMRGQGLFEVNTYPFISPDDIVKFKLGQAHMKLQNPRSQEQAYLRNSLLPQLVRTAADNSSYKGRLAMFEIARVFLPPAKGELPQESERLGAFTLHENALLHAKGLLDKVFELAHLSAVKFEAVQSKDWLHPSRQSVVKSGDQVIGYYGQLHPEITERMKLPQAAYMELEMRPLLEQWSLPVYTPLNRYQSGYRDLTIYVPQQITWQEVAAAIESTEGVLPSFRDEYIREQDKALTIHLEMVPDKATLTDKVIEARLRQVVENLQQRFGAKT